MGNKKRAHAKSAATATATATATPPFVSVCTPTFNRRPFIAAIVRCFEAQTYPRDRMEWIIVDDGSDKIGDLVAHLPYVRYFAFDAKMPLGQKRNLTNDLARGDILVYMDDDDYYPPERVQHAVETLQRNPAAMCVGSSEMFIYFKHVHKMVKFGPYGPAHATAATFAFRRELLATSRFSEDAAVAEEKHFLKNYTVPFAQLDSRRSILVFAHDQNSFDKKELLAQAPNKTMTESALRPADFVRDPAVLRFFTEEVDALIAAYEPGEVRHKQDVLQQLARLREQRTLDRQRAEEKRGFEQELGRLQQENARLAEQTAYLTAKLASLIRDQIRVRSTVASTASTTAASATAASATADAV